MSPAHTRLGRPALRAGHQTVYITVQNTSETKYWSAEDYHQHYSAKNGAIPGSPRGVNDP